MRDKIRELSRVRRIAYQCVTLILGLLLGIAVAEAGLRLIGYSSPEFYRPDETLGYTLEPGITGHYSKEGSSFVRVNSDGFRDVEHAIEKPDDTFRIAVVGDSYVEALQVEQDEIFTNVVAQKLANCNAFGGKRIEMLTFGVSGYGFAQELLMMREKVWKYRPDLVLLLVTTNNDISDNYRAFKKAPIPYFVLSNGELALDASFREERAFVVRNSTISRVGMWFKQHCRVVQGVGEATTKIKYWLNDRNRNRSGNPPSVGAADPQPVAEVGIDNQIYVPPATENWSNAWAVSEAILLKMASEASAHGSAFLVVTGSNGIQVLPSASEKAAFARGLGLSDLFYPDRRIADLCRTNSIPVITLAPILSDYAESNNVVLHGFAGNLGYGHWNQTGHRVAGEMIGSSLCKMEKTTEN